jgi:hypothetical protein
MDPKQKYPWINSRGIFYSSSNLLDLATKDIESPTTYW